MGRHTFASLGCPLAGRTNIVVTRDLALRADGILVAHSLEAALAYAEVSPEVFVIGGATLYAQALPRADRLYLTRIDANFAGDTYFPPVDPDRWQEVSRQNHSPDAENPWPYAFTVLERVNR
jgi:dihydrofolate reductase